MENHAPAQQELEQLISRVVNEVKCRLGGSNEFVKSEKRLNAAYNKDTIEQKDADAKQDSRNELLLCGSLSNEEMEQLSSFYRIKQKVESTDWDVLLLARLSVVTMAYAANGISGNPEASCILRGLLSGKKVFVLEQGIEYRSFRESAGKNLYRLYLQQEETLKNIGVEVISYAADVMRMSMDRGVNWNRPLEASAEHGDGRHIGQDIMNPPEWKLTGCTANLSHLGLLRESDVMRVRNAGSQGILLGRATKITPLAMDYITSHSLSVVRQ